MIFKSYGGSIPPRATRVGVVIERCTVSEGHAEVSPMYYLAPAPTPQTKKDPAQCAATPGSIKSLEGHHGHYHMAACRRGS